MDTKRRQKKNREKPPRFRPDGSANRPMRRLIRIHFKKIKRMVFNDGATSDDSAEDTKDAPVIINSLSAWRQEKYHGDRRVPTGGDCYDNDDFRTSDRGGDQHYLDDDKHFQGNGEFHGGNAQNFHDDDRNVYDGNEKVDDYEKVYDDERVYDGDQNFLQRQSTLRPEKFRRWRTTK